MYSISAQQAAILATGKYTARLRCQVQDAGGTYRNLSQDYGGWDFQLQGTTSQSIDDSVGSFEVELKRELYAWSLAPLMTGSAINLATYLNPTSSYSPLLDCGRKIKLEFAILPLDGAPVSSDWALLVEGYIDIVDPGDGENIHLTCRDLGAHLGDTFIQDERVYGLVTAITTGPLIWAPNTVYPANAFVLPTQLNGSFYKTTAGGTSGAAEPTWPGSGSVGDGTVTWTQQGAATWPGTGVQVETVMQAIIADAGLADTLSTPVSPGWAILTFKQQRQSILDAVRSLVQQIGWDIRYLFGSGAGVLTFYQPQRTSPTVLYTFQKGVIPKQGVTKCGLNVAGIRNVVRVVYNDSNDRDANGVPKRKYIQVQDNSSITRFGGIPRFMEISEDWTSKIDTSGEATTMANACLNDLSSPLADYEVEIPFFPFAEIGDYYTFKADGLHFDQDQSFGVVGIAHTFSKDKVRTTLTCRGKPSGAYKAWHDIAASPSYNSPRNGQIPTHSLAGIDGPLTLTTTPTVTGTRISIPFNRLKESTWAGFEFHLSSSNASPPSSSTLLGANSSGAFEAHGLDPNKTWYWAIVPLRKNGSQLVRGQPSAWQSFTPVTVNPLHILPDTIWNDSPPNADFGSFTAGSTSPPDRWSMVSGVWGTGFDVQQESSVIFDGLYSLKFNSLNVSEIQSDYFPIKSMTDYFVDYVFRNTDGAATFSVDVTWWTAKGSANGTTTISSPPSPAANTWKRVSARMTPPAGSAYARIQVADSLVSGHVLYIGYCRMHEVKTPEPWNVVGAASQPAFGANFANFGGAEAVAAFQKSINGETEGKGLVTCSAAKAAASVIYTLPAGYRPAENRSFSQRWISGGVETTMSITVTSGGAVQINKAMVNGDSVGLSFNFLAEQ